MSGAPWGLDVRWLPANEGAALMADTLAVELVAAPDSEPLPAPGEVVPARSL